MSRPRVTITLGRTGQVVTRAGHTSDGTHSEYVQLSGSKRSIRERLGSNVENPLLYGRQTNSKRQRQYNQKQNLRDNMDDDRQYISNSRRTRFGQEDLRLKLMRKNSSRRTLSDGEEQNDVDLREKLSRMAQSPARINTRSRVLDPRATGILRRIPPTRSADDLLQMDSLRKSYSVWTLDDLRRRSPERGLGASRAISPPRNMDGHRQIAPLRPLDASRSVPFVPKGAVPLEAAKPAVRLAPVPPGVMQKSSYLAEEPTVAGLLRSLGLGKYSILFQAEEVDMTALKQMGDNDLKELGIPMPYDGDPVRGFYVSTVGDDATRFQGSRAIPVGPRKKILLALLPRSKHRQS